MKDDVQLLLQGVDDDFERRVLASASLDQGSQETLARTLNALGLRPGMGPDVVQAGATTAAGAGAAPDVVAHTSASSSLRRVGAQTRRRVASRRRPPAAVCSSASIAPWQLGGGSSTPRQGRTPRACGSK